MKMAKKQRKFIKRIEKTVDWVFVGFLLIVLLYSAYSWWDTNRMYQAAASSNYAMFRPSPVLVDDNELGFEELRQINPNVFGWVHIFGTHIDYPLLQTTDNYRYVYHSARGVPSRAGAIFLDFRNRRDFTDFNNIIYGHDMDRGAMFGDLARFEEEYFFDTHRFGTIFNGDRFYGIEVFAFMLIDANDGGLYNPNIILDVDKEAFFERIYDDAIQVQDDIFETLTTDDRLVMLSTCTQVITNGRHVLFGRLMDEIPEDTIGGQSMTGGLDALLAGIGEFGLILGAALVVVLTAGITFFIADARRKKKLLKEHGELVQKANKRRKLSIWEESLFLVGKLAMVLMVLFIFFNYAFGITNVADASMAPAMQQGDIVLFQRIAANYVIAMDVVVVENGQGTQVRRVVAVAGDVVDINDQGLFVNGRPQSERHIYEITEYFEEGVEFPLTVPYNQVFVLGDSRTRSRDSRIYGPVSLEDVLGSVVTIFRGRNL